MHTHEASSNKRTTIAAHVLADMCFCLLSAYVTDELSWSLEDCLLSACELVKRKTQFTSKCPANEIVTKIEAAAGPMGFDVKKNNYKVFCCIIFTHEKNQAARVNYQSRLSYSIAMVEMKKSRGDALEFHKFYKNLTTGLKDIV
ncbi:hypothetical protein Bca52824_055324 [Brassica carinata]|uniref:NAF domain-containing protein n=1 Tax=Brassica carinata TaxID=52824 RepID=A0A8X7R7U0_BRACI|nr:hypothetical protein Bca52824_055324 [Brassica carinata]